MTRLLALLLLAGCTSPPLCPAEPACAPHHWEQVSETRCTRCGAPLSSLEAR